MQELGVGEYTGEIIQTIEVDDCILTNTHYSRKVSNPDWHFHKNLHVCFVFQGGKAETKRSIQFTEKTGSIFFYHAGEKHRWISPQAISKSANIEISHAFLSSYNLSEASIKENIFKNVNSKSLFLKIQNEMLLDDINSKNSIHSVLLALLSNNIDASKSKIPKWFLKLNTLLHDNWQEQMSLKEMSLIIGVHPVTISKAFPKYYNCTLGEYQRRLRIEESLQLIKYSKLTLSEIAYFCGFADQSHFTRNFKTMTGFLPKHFRKF